MWVIYYQYAMCLKFLYHVLNLSFFDFLFIFFRSNNGDKTDRRRQFFNLRAQNFADWQKLYLRSITVEGSLALWSNYKTNTNEAVVNLLRCFLRILSSVNFKFMTKSKLCWILLFIFEILCPYVKIALYNLLYYLVLCIHLNDYSWRL